MYIIIIIITVHTVTLFTASGIYILEYAGIIFPLHIYHLKLFDFKLIPTKKKFILLASTKPTALKWWRAIDFQWLIYDMH
jgi:hypothetical protein